MNQLFADIDAWLLALGLAVVMLAGWWGGRWWGRLRPKDPSEAPQGRLQDASLAILGLLLGFTFAMSLSKHEQRRLMVVADSNGVGDFYTCASLVKPPERERLQAITRGYAEHRLMIARGRLDETAMQARLTEVQRMHADMQNEVDKAITSATPVVVPLVNTFNNLTSNHAARLAAVRDRLPASIVFLLYFSATVSLGLVGFNQGAAGEHHPTSPIAFIALVSLVVWVILDLNQPDRGMITVSQEPMARVLATMEK
jgi:hypothetical protein